MKAGVLAVSIAFVVILVAVTPSTAELVQVDPAWPSIGPGSDGPSAQPQSVEMQIEGGSAPLLLAPFAAEATGPSTPVAFGFAGVDGTAKDGSLHKPANTHLAVGTGTGGAGRVVMVTSSGIQIWDTMGNPLAGPTPLDTFLGTPAPSAFDPKVLFDQHSGRFVIVILRGKTSNPTGLSNLHIAVSTTRAPSNLTTDWTNLAGSALTSLGGIETWFDDPSIGADRDSLVVTGNLFDSSGTYQGVKIRVFTKASLLAGSYTFLDLDMPDPDRSMFTVQPAHVYGEATDSGNFYLINRVGTTRYRLWEISGAPGAPTIVGNAPQPWSAGSTVSGGAPQSGTATTLPTLSPRVMNAVYRSGHVWLALSSDTDADGKTEVFWAKIATNGGLPAAPTVADSGSIDGSDGDGWVFNPSISVNVSGDAVICYSQSFSDQFPDMRYVSRASTDPPGTFGASVVAMTSPGFYDAFSTANPWGEYSATVVDPDDDLTFWIANEVVKTSGVDTSIWGTFVAKLRATSVTTSSTTSSSTTTTRSTTSSSTATTSSSTSSSTATTRSPTSSSTTTTSSSTSSSTTGTVTTRSTTPPVAFGFAGVDGTAKDGSLHKPANTHIAVGTGTDGAGRVVMVTSSGIQIWDKMGNPL